MFLGTHRLGENQETNGRDKAVHKEWELCKSTHLGSRAKQREGKQGQGPVKVLTLSKFTEIKQTKEEAQTRHKRTISI